MGANALTVGSTAMPSINLDRLLADLENLGRFGATDRGGVNRPIFSEADLAARAWLEQRCGEAGLGFRQDAIGNIFMSLPEEPGSSTNRAKVWTGSHIDTVPDGGRLDGAYGVMAGLECLRTMAEAGLTLSPPVEVVAFADEEGAYGSFLGSRALANGLSADYLEPLTGRDGTPLADALARIGSNIEDVANQVPVGADDVAAFVELHIEQGPVLESAGLEVGVVTDIVEVGHGKVTFFGQADHAGTTPMALRRDATRAAGSFLIGLPGVPADHGSANAVATCGMMSVEPGAANIVAEEVHLVVDIRDRAGGVADLQQGVEQLAERSAAEHDLGHEVIWGVVTPGVTLDQGVQQHIAAAADLLGASNHRMVSGAGHDAQVMAQIVPSAMIFVPSENGRSHSPVESTSPEHLGIGANVLLQTLISLAQDSEAP